MPVPENQTRVHDDLQLSPALEAIKQVYLEAYKYGMSTAFITGRNEGSRDHTEANLKSVGLGEKCAQDGHGNVIRSQDKPCYVALHLRDLKSMLPRECMRQAHVNLSGRLVHRLAVSHAFLRRNYARIHPRRPLCITPCTSESALFNANASAEDMSKLASVYKPERRKQLVDAGFTIVATFGDQFSDSDGMHSASAAYKMPNPLYYIL